MIFQRSALLEAALPLGVGMHTVSTLVGSLVFAKLSGCKAVIAGPDINPAVFIAEATSAIVEAICPTTVDDGSGSGSSSDSHGRLLASSLVPPPLPGLPGLAGAGYEKKQLVRPPPPTPPLLLLLLLLLPAPKYPCHCHC